MAQGATLARNSCTHRVAISDHRILELHHDQVTFTWRDRADDNRTPIQTP